MDKYDIREPSRIIAPLHLEQAVHVFDSGRSCAKSSAIRKSKKANGLAGLLCRTSTSALAPDF
jgi:hypothetical protein